MAFAVTPLAPVAPPLSPSNCLHGGRYREMPDWRPSGRHLYLPVSASTCVRPPLPCVGAPAAAVEPPELVAPVAAPGVPAAAPVAPWPAPRAPVPVAPVCAALPAAAAVSIPVSPPPWLFDGISTTSSTTATIIASVGPYRSKKS